MISDMIVEFGFENLDVWKKSISMTTDIYRHFKESRDYGFKDQITRSALSIPSNISEGYERISVKEKCHFYNIAGASTGELRTQIFVGIEIGYIPLEIGKNWIQQTREISSMLVGLIKSIQNKC